MFEYIKSVIATDVAIVKEARKAAKTELHIEEHPAIIADNKRMKKVALVAVAGCAAFLAVALTVNLGAEETE